MFGLAALPLPLLGLLVIGGPVVVALAGLMAFHRISHLRALRGENDVAGFVYAAVGVVYGILLAFVVFAVWERYASVDQAVTAEAADLITVFRDSQFLPPQQRAMAQAGLIAYAHSVTGSEWSEHGQLRPHRTADPLNRVWKAFLQVKPTTGWGIAQLQNSTAQLYELEHQRHLRHLSTEATLPDVFWIVLILGGALTVGFSYFFLIEDFRVQAAMTGVLAALLGSVLFLIVSLNDPFTGQVHVSKYPFEHALQQFHALSIDSP